MRLFRAGVVFACVAYLCMLYAFPLLDVSLYANDMNGNLAWAHRLRDPSLFPGNQAVAYERHYYGGVAFAALYWVGTRTLEVMTFGKLLPFALGGLMLAAGYRIGKRSSGGNRLAGVAAVLLLMALRVGVFIDIWSGAQGGLPRGFYYPLLLLGCMGLLERRDWLVALAAFCGALFYAPVYLVLGLSAVLMLAFERAPLRARVRRALVLAPAGLLGGALLLWHARGDAQFGALLDWAHASALPIMRRGGVVPDVLAPTRLGSLVASHFGLSWPPLMIAAVCALVWWRRQRVPRGLEVCAALAGAGMLGHIAAYALYFHLYIPARYSQALQLAAWLCAALTASEALSLKTARGPTLAAGLGLFTILVGLNAVRIHPGPNDTGHTGIYRTRLPPGIRAAIAALPPDSTIAVHAEMGGDIQFLCKRNAYVELEGLFPFHARFHTEQRARVLLQARALYATHWEDVTSFSRLTGVRYALVDPAIFAPAFGEWAAFYPELRAPELPAGDRFALAAPIADRIVARDGDFLLIDIRP